MKFQPQKHKCQETGAKYNNFYNQGISFKLLQLQDVAKKPIDSLIDLKLYVFVESEKGNLVSSKGYFYCLSTYNKDF